MINYALLEEKKELVSYLVVFYMLNKYWFCNPAVKKSNYIFMHLVIIDITCSVGLMGRYGYTESVTTTYLFDNHIQIYSTLLSEF